MTVEKTYSLFFRKIFSIPDKYIFYDSNDELSYMVDKIVLFK